MSPTTERQPSDAVRCWCGNADLTSYSPGYARCPRCESLVASEPPRDPARVADEQTSLYGINYFHQHAEAFGHPSLEQRARLDLSDRCAHWLRVVLEHRPPPARTLELGSANGAFVGLLAQAGYQAAGLDLSPAVTAFAREAFQVPVLTGPIEAQRLEPGALDLIAMMDVLEHLPDPVATLRACAAALAPDGLLLVQTPRYDPGRSYQESTERQDPFLEQLKAGEHLFLLSPSAARRLLAEAGFAFLEFVPAIFAHYDMSFVASRAPIARVPEEAWRGALRRTRSGRIVEGLVDARERWQEAVRALEDRLAAIERDRAERLEFIHRQQAHIEEIERDRAARLDVIHRTQQELDALRVQFEHALRFGPLSRLVRPRPPRI